MTTNETRRHEMFIRIREFGITHRDRFPGETVGGQAFATVDAAVAELDVQAVLQLRARQEGQHLQQQTRATLEAALDAIRRTARVLASDHPEVADRFGQSRRQGRQALLTTARACANDAAPLETAFVAHGLPATFLADLHQDIDAFAEAIRQRQAGRAGTTEARTRIKAALVSGTAAARRLDVVIANQFRDDAAALAVWRHDRRLRSPRGARREEPAPTPPTDTGPVPNGERVAA